MEAFSDGFEQKQNQGTIITVMCNELQQVKNVGMYNETQGKSLIYNLQSENRVEI